MKINSNIFSIPPYISTQWQHVSTLLMKDSNLIVNLVDGRTIEIPNLDPALISSIFNLHSAAIEQQNQLFPQISSPSLAESLSTPLMNKLSFGVPFKMGIGMGSIDDIGIGSSVFQHNSAQGNTPDIPAEILEKIVMITKIIAPDDAVTFPKAEPHCNCVHCQVSRSVNPDQPLFSPHESNGEAVQIPKIEEEVIVTDDELTFQEWTIASKGEHLFSVTNRLDSNEKYNVFLGDPIGCTCGKTGCEHIIAVLKS